MIVASFNVRGLGGGLKMNKIKELLRHHKIDFFGNLRDKDGGDFGSVLCIDLG